ncbi:MAG: methionine-gamma-lyase [Miltoncostaeaceae bacterium]|nr:methionine-gamma-lyase [Miltoncostaeaceae bacterium]
MHSATKYLGGHSDLTAGAVMGSAELLKPIWNWRKSLGQIIAPEVAFLLSRSLRTLVVRVRAQNAGAEAVARFLAGHPKVVETRHPALLEGRAAEIAARQMRGSGGMVTFTVDGDEAGATAVVDRLRLIANAVSLGSVESLATQPVASTHHDLTPEERDRRGIAAGLVRLSIGLEDPEDLIADLDQALSG